MHVPQRFVFVLAVSLAFPLAGRAELRFERPQVDLGEVRGGKPLTHRFAFINAGDEFVELLEVKPGCGCLKPRVTHLRLPPKQAGAIEVDVNTLGHADGPPVVATADADRERVVHDDEPAAGELLLERAELPERVPGQDTNEDHCAHSRGGYRTGGHARARRTGDGSPGRSCPHSRACACADEPTDRSHEPTDRSDECERRCSIGEPCADFRPGPLFDLS